MRNQAENPDGQPARKNTPEEGADSTGAVPGLRTFSSFRNRYYRFYFGGLVGQMGAMNVQMLARSLLIYRLTGSAAILGVMALANALPMIVLAMFGGVIADRIQKKYVMMAGQAASAVVTITIAVALTSGFLSTANPGSWWLLIFTSIIQGTIMALMMPSRQAILAEIVSQKQLMNAVALNVLGMNTLRLLAPAMAGFLIDTMGFATIFYVVTGMYLMAIFFISFIPATGAKSILRQSTISNLRDGFRYVRQETTILSILVMTLFMVVLSMPYLQLMPIFADDILNVGATGMGILISASGLGAIIGSIFLASAPNRKRGLLLLGSGLLLGLTLVAFAFSRYWYLSLALMVLIGLGQTGRMTLANTLLQHYVANEYRGRVMSLYLMEFGFTNFGVFFAGVVAEAIGPQWSIGGMAATLILAIIAALIFLPRLRKLE